MLVPPLSLPALLLLWLMRHLALLVPQELLSLTLHRQLPTHSRLA